MIWGCFSVNSTWALNNNKGHNVEEFNLTDQETESGEVIN